MSKDEALSAAAAIFQYGHIQFTDTIEELEAYEFVVIEESSRTLGTQAEAQAEAERRAHHRYV